ncbi:Isoprenyl transferase [[Clostridium] cellulosi]|uniref:Isoprenyl transferase n=1 Tax=[Clostridium] cellulosi TaxID=29343 RepID=A0A078KLZ9_9FIRM|nr:MAG: isoprenyl transferase [[Clostridium] cellulosi]CDZ24756.1 Isoprenyl transferase [[Clostridium] cellulosi]
MLFFDRKKIKGKEAERERKLPQHIGIIMDGNGRWAKKRGLPRTAGHSVGASTFKNIAKYCNKIGLKYLTVYAFSTENWKRPQEEVDAIMDLFRQYLKDSISSLDNDNIKIRFIGDISALADDLQKLIKEAEEDTADATGLTLNIAINYGGRQEIVAAAKKLCEDISKGILDPSDISEEEISKRIYTAGQPDPDLIIRPSGEKRISNFMLWQSAYTEFWYSDVLWPDFSPRHLEMAIDDYNKRIRRFGGI